MTETSPASRRFDPWLLAVVVAAVLVHCAVLGGEFFYDDQHAVRDNPAIRSLASIPSFFVDPAAFSGAGAVMYRPVVLSSLALSHVAFGGSHFGFALGDLLLHAGNALLLVAVALRLGLPQRAARFAGLLFAVHPLTALGVHLASSRSDQLLLTGALLALLGYGMALRGRRRGAWAAAAGVAIACGSKETGVMVPGMLLAMEWSLRRGRLQWPATAQRLLPSTLVVGAYLTARKILLGMATVAPTLSGGVDVQTGHGRDLVTQFATMGELLPRVVLQSVVPVGLSLDPPIRFLRDPLTATSLAGWAAVLSLTLVALWVSRRRPAVAVGAALIWGTALPWVLVPLNAPLTENRLYGWVAGVALVAAPFVAGWTRAVRGGVATGPVWLTAAVLTTLAAVTVQRGRTFADPPRAWRAVLEWNPHSERAYSSLADYEVTRANSLRAVGRLEDAERVAQGAAELLERSIAAWPGSVRARRGIIELRCSMGPDARGALRAVPHAERACDDYPDSPRERLNLSSAYQLAGEISGEERWFERAVAAALSTLEVAPPKGLVFRRAAAVRSAQGRPAAAVELLDRAVAQGFRDAGLLAERGMARLRAGDGSGARADAAEALRQNPFHPAARAVMHELSAARPPR